MPENRVQDLVPPLALQQKTNAVGALVLNILQLQMHEAVSPSHREQGCHEREDQDEVHLGGGCSTQLPQDRHREGDSLLIRRKRQAPANPASAQQSPS